MASTSSFWRRSCLFILPVPCWKFGDDVCIHIEEDIVAVERSSVSKDGHDLLWNGLVMVLIVSEHEPSVSIKRPTTNGPIYDMLFVKKLGKLLWNMGS